MLKQRLIPVSALSPVGLSVLTRRRAGPSLWVLALLIMCVASGPVSAQAPQPGTPAPAPSVPPGNSPRAEGPAQAAPVPEMGEEDEDDSEGCPYLGQPLELVV